MNWIRWSVLVFSTVLASLAPLSGGASEHGVREQADTGVALSGRLVTCGDAVPGEVVQLVEPGPQPKVVRRSRSDQHGFFELRAPRPGVWTVAVRSDTGAVLQRRVALLTATVLPPVRMPDASCGEEIPSGWHATESGSATAATPTAMLSGRVVSIAPGAAGVPVEGAWVWSDDPSVPITRSRADGSYRLQVPTGRLFKLSAAGDGFFPMTLPVRIARDVPEDRGPIFSLTPAAYLRGRVVAGELPGTTRLDIEPAHPNRSATEDSPPRREQVYAAPSGVFWLLAAPNTTYELTASQAGFVPEVVEVRSGAPGSVADPVTIRLRRGATLSGRLADQSGVPVPEARVTLVPETEETRTLALLAGRTGHEDHPTTRSTSDGNFEISPVSPGDHDLVVLADGFEPLAIPGIEISPDASVHELHTVHLKPAARLEGVVTDPGGYPIEGARVAVSLLATDGRSAAGRPGDAAVTDEEGRFEVVGLSTGRKVHLAVRKDGFLPRLVPAQEVPQDRAIRVTLELAGEVIGRVVDPTGTPAEGALVRVQPEAADGASVRRSQMRGGSDLTALTDARGRFHVGGIEPGVVEIFASADCCRPAFQRHQVKPGEADSEIEIVLPPGLRLEGTVLDPRHQPLPGVVVSAEGRSVHTAADGRFRLTGLDMAAVELHAWHSELGSVRRTVDPAADEPVEIVYAAPAVLSLRFEDDLGRPLPGVGVFIGDPEPQHPHPLTTSSGGTLETTLQPGTYRLVAHHPEVLPPPEQTVTLEPAEERHLTVALDRGTMLRGRLLGSSRDELRGAAVRAARGRRARTGEVTIDGQYRIAGLEAGLWVISASLGNGRRAETTVEIAEGQRHVEADLEFGRGEAVRGSVELDGEPLAGAWLTISSLQGTPLARTATDASGRFEVSGVTAERVQVDLSNPAGDIRYSRTLDLHSAAELEIHLWTGLLSGMVRADATGLPITNAQVRLDPLADSTLLGRRSSTRPDGRFGAVRMPEGTYRLTISAPGYAETATDVTVLRDAEVTVELALVVAQEGNDTVTNKP